MWLIHSHTNEAFSYITEYLH